MANIQKKSPILALALVCWGFAASAFTPVTGEVVHIDSELASTQMMLRADLGDSLSAGCQSFLVAADITGQYQWSDCAVHVLQDNDAAKFMTITVRRPDGSTYVDPHGLIAGEAYLFPVHLNASGEPVLTPAAPLSLTELQRGQIELRALMAAQAVQIAENSVDIAATNERVYVIQKTADAAASAAERNAEALAEDGWVRGELAAIDDRFNSHQPISWWVIMGLVCAVIALLGMLYLWWSKVSKGDFAAVKATADEASEKASSAETNASEAKTKIDGLTDRVRDVEEVQILHLTADAQGRFNCPNLTDQRLKVLGENEVITLEMVCLDNRARKIRVSKGVGGDGKPRLHLHGLAKGHDFVDSISLVALYRHLVKARQKNWIIGLTAANKLAA